MAAIAVNGGQKGAENIAKSVQLFGLPFSLGVDGVEVASARGRSDITREGGKYPQFTIYTERLFLTMNMWLFDVL